MFSVCLTLFGAYHYIIIIVNDFLLNYIIKQLCMIRIFKNINFSTTLHLVLSLSSLRPPNLKNENAIMTNRFVVTCGLTDVKRLVVKELACQPQTTSRPFLILLSKKNKCQCPSQRLKPFSFLASLFLCLSITPHVKKSNPMIIIAQQFFLPQIQSDKFQWNYLISQIGLINFMIST